MAAEAKSMLAGLVGAAVLLAGCGAGNPGLPKAEWITRADKICATARDDIAALPRPGTLAEVGAYATKTRKIAERELGALRNLDAPRTDRDTVMKMLQFVEDGIHATERVEKAAKNGDAEAATSAIDEVNGLTDRANKLARDYGLQVCGGKG